MGITVWVNIKVDGFARSLPFHFDEPGMDPLIAGYFACTSRADLSPSALRRRSKEVTSLVRRCRHWSTGAAEAWLAALPRALEAAKADPIVRGEVSGAWEFLMYLSGAGHLDEALLWAFLVRTNSLVAQAPRVGGRGLLSHIVPAAPVTPSGLAAVRAPRKAKAVIGAAGTGHTGRPGKVPALSFPLEHILAFFVKGLRRGPSKVRGRGEGPDERLAADYRIMQFLYFLILAFGCLRGSEPLHLYEGDVSFDFETGEGALVSLWHPVKGPEPYVCGRRPRTREVYLREEFGLVPRNHATGNQRVGWKNLLLDESIPGVGIRARVVWVVPEIGRLFWRMHRAYVGCVRPMGLAHPFYFSSSSNNTFGTPWTLDSADDAFERSLAQLGLVPDSSKGLCMHGWRHRAKNWMDLAGLTPQYKQVALHQQSINSQNDYGRVGPVEAAGILGDAISRRAGTGKAAIGGEPSAAACRFQAIGTELARHFLERYDDLV